jgi:uncharacterized damage-inducible protein DinB
LPIVGRNAKEPRLNLTDLIRFHLAHSTWAITQLLDAAGSLPADAIEQNLDIGPGGVRENIAHTIEAMFFFADNFAGREYTEPAGFAERARSLSGLRSMLDQAAAKLKSAMLTACEPGLVARVTWPNAEARSLPAAAAVAQVFDHAALHRAQCINMLKRLGFRPVPDLDPMTFQATGLPW